ncbi:MAG: FG-GAP-like repeat-containing protein [Patescibacteria group bacterium]
MPKKYYVIILVPMILIGTFFVFERIAEAAYGDTTTYVGKIYSGDGSPATDAYVDFPDDLAFDTAGNLYVADTYNNVIRKIDTSGTISTYAGTGSYGSVNGSATSAKFALPKGIAVDSSGNVFVSDTYNNQIRKIDIYGSVSTYVSSGLAMPEGIVAFGNYFYVADTNNNAVKKVNRGTGEVTTLTTSISSPRKMDISSDGGTLYVADQGHYQVVGINTSSGAVSVIAGSGTEGYQEGTGTAAQFRSVYGVGYDAASNSLFVTDEGADRIAMIRKIDLSTGITSLFVSDTSMTTVYPNSGIRIYGEYLYLGGNGTIHRFNKNNAADNNLVAGKDRFGNTDGALGAAVIGRPYDIVLSSDGNNFYLAENNKIRKINRVTGEVSFVIGNSIDSYDFEQKTGSQVRFSNISGITINSAGDTLYVVDRWNNRIRGINIATQSTFLVAGGGNYNVTGSGNGYAEGAGEAARFDIPADLVISPDGQYLYVTDTGNNRIRKIRISDGQTSLIAGSGEAGFADGKGSAVKFNTPYGLDIDTSGQYLYVADRDNHRIRRVKISDGDTVTIAGDGRNGYLDGLTSKAVFSYPVYVKYYANNIYVSDSGSHRVRVIELSGGVVKLVAGSGSRGYKNGSRTAAEFNNLMGTAVDAANKYLYVCDSWNDMIRKIDISGQAPYTDAAPVVTAVQPNKLKIRTDENYQAYLDVLGQNFRHGAVTQFGDFSATTYVKSATAMTVVIPLGKMSPGYYDVKVTNSDGQADILSVGFAVSNAAGVVPAVYNTLETGEGFYAYASTFAGGVKTATGDVNGDGQIEIITATGEGGGPQVRVFDSQGNVLSQFFAYASTFRQGFNVAVGDVDGDGVADIVAAAGPGGGPHVRVFDYQGHLKSQFFAYALNFRKGIKLAVGDINADGMAEIVTGTDGPSAPHVRIFNYQGKLLGQFFAYPTTFRIGINVAIGDVNGDGVGEIITAPIYNGGPHARVFNASGKLLSQFFAYGLTYRGGVNLATGDVNGDGRTEIITGTSVGKAPHVRMFNNNGSLVGQFFAASTSSRRGIYVSAGDINNDGSAEIVTSQMSGSPEIVTFDYQGNIVK